MSGHEKLNLLLNNWDQIRNIIKIKVKVKARPRTGHEVPEGE
jgi:hypothetical protein